jgi:hypothetical protein
LPGRSLANGNHQKFRQLKWWAQAGFPQGSVFEITQACQPQGTKTIARLCNENSLSTVLLGACHLSRGEAELLAAMREQGDELKLYRELDVCQKAGWRGRRSARFQAMPVRPSTCWPQN